MLRLVARTVIWFCCFVPFGWAQQETGVAYFEAVRVKPDQAEKYETTLKRHWDFHEKQGETWNYFVWTVDSGKNEGAYQIASFGHTWREVDESDLLVAGTPGADENPEPYQQNTEESYYRHRQDLSIGAFAKQRLPVASVTRILLNPEAVRDFEAALQQISKAISGGSRPASFSAQWYELVTGGDSPQFLLIEERPDWSALGGNGEFDAIKSGIDKSKVSDGTVKALWRSIRSIYVETWHYRSDLSRVRK